MNVVWIDLILMILLAMAVILLTYILRKQSKTQIGAVVVVFALSSVGFYLYWGDSQSLAQWYQAQQRAELIKDFVAKYRSVDEIIALMQQRLKEHPEDAKGWYLLGRLYRSQGNLKAAEEAFAKAKEL